MIRGVNEKKVDALIGKTYSQRNVSYSQHFHICRICGTKGGIQYGTN